ncbi:MAG: metallophosphoesterase [Acidobacteriota bacterium]|nr:metallophosphoesterase [Acidobacteriota bacterium]
MLAAAVGLWLFANRAAAQKDAFPFVILGDRTGEAQPGVYERVWRAAAAETPAFVVSVGDSIEGLNDAAAEDEWRRLEQILTPYRQIPLFLAPGNHDIWSAQSQAVFAKHAGHPLHYSFDRGPVHVTVLDNSRSDALAAGELRFLDEDLEAHKDQPVKFVVMHRPSWLVDAMFQNPRFPLHQLAKKYGVRYVIAGHLHQMLEVELEGVTYLSMASAGGHLRGSERYEDGWFFGYAVAGVRGNDVAIQIKELAGRVSAPKDWSKVGAKAAGSP